MKVQKFLILIILFFGLILDLGAQTRLSVSGSSRLYPLAVPQLCGKGASSEQTKEVARVITRDLTMSGYFDILNSESYIETPGKCGDTFAFTDWTVLGVDGLVKGEIEQTGQQIKVRLFLHDVQIQKLELAKEYSGDIAHIRDIAHKFSNEVLKYFTGEFGPFGTKIAYSQRVGRFKEIFVMDLDGANVRQLTSDNGLALSSSWSPDHQSILFTNFQNRQPDLFSIGYATRRQQKITNTVQQELGGKFSPDGSKIIIARSEGQKSDILLLDKSGRELSKLTRNYASIDVSPDWSPDGTRIVFTSNRSGGPQIYTMSADGSGAKRVSYVSSNYCTSPVWSPKGEKIAYVCRSEGKHNVFVSNADGTQPSQLTSSGSNEDPSWSPDGRYLVFSSTAFGSVYQLGMIRLDGANLIQVNQSQSGSFDPSWSSWIN